MAKEQLQVGQKDAEQPRDVWEGVLGPDDSRRRTFAPITRLFTAGDVDGIQESVNKWRRFKNRRTTDDIEQRMDDILAEVKARQEGGQTNG